MSADERGTSGPEDGEVGTSEVGDGGKDGAGTERRGGTGAWPLVVVGPGPDPVVAPRPTRPDPTPLDTAVQAVQRVTALAFGPYQSALIRIGFALTWLLFLLREFPHRQELYGPDGPWSWSLAKQLLADDGAFSALMWSDSGTWFEIVYAAAVVVSVLLILGWRTRTMSVLFMVGVLSLQNRSIFVGDGGDNVLHLMAIYLVFTRCGQVWSLDARRAARAAAEQGEDAARRDRVGPALWALMGVLLVVGSLTGGFEIEVWLRVVLWGSWVCQGLWWAANRFAGARQERALLDVFANLLHNAALVVIVVEVCFIYATAGWYKIQGSRWEDGTALYYPLKLHYFAPWPELSNLLAASSLLVMVFSYGTVMVQVAFPFTLFNRRIKNVLLAMMIMEHLGIAVLLGLPFFSLAMITADAVFLPTNFLTWLGGRIRLAADRLPGRRAAVPGQRRIGAEESRTLVG